MGLPGRITSIHTRTVISQAPEHLLSLLITQRGSNNHLLLLLLIIILTKENLCSRDVSTDLLRNAYHGGAICLQFPPITEGCV
jgi:hypothetical protein